MDTRRNSRPFWTKQETLYLINLMKEKDFFTLLQKKRYRTASIYKLMEEQMREAGSEKNHEQIRAKWKALKASYAAARKGVSYSNNREVCPFEPELDALLGKRYNSNLSKEPDTSTDGLDDATLNSADDAVAEDDITEYILEPVCNGNSDTADNDNEPLFGRSSPFRQVPKLYAKPRRSDRKFFTNSVSETEWVRNCHNFSHLKAQELKLKVSAAKDALTYAQECFRAKMKREDEAHQQKLRLEEESHQQKIRHAEDLHRLNVEKMRKDLGLVLREHIDSNQTSQGETCDENILQYDTPMLEN
uniref:Myb/SANT-like DNA-binding domain-containing protein n=1 Tax=Timema shepardi TaxID=629360 RepID=A0A7R9AYD4_TIMSH|nr:unnamed protein product [Timema shepardi]